MFHWGSIYGVHHSHFIFGGHILLWFFSDCIQTPHPGRRSQSSVKVNPSHNPVCPYPPFDFKGKTTWGAGLGGDWQQPLESQRPWQAREWCSPMTPATKPVPNKCQQHRNHGGCFSVCLFFLLNIKISAIFKCQKREKQIHPFKSRLNGDCRFFMSFSVSSHLGSVLMHALGFVGGLLTLAFMHFPQVIVKQSLQSSQKVAPELQNVRAI